MKSIKIKGNDYIQVNERVKEFHKNYPNGSIVTNIISSEGGVFITKTIVTPDSTSPDRKFTGLAYEVIGEGMVNSTSALENCETSRCGRALGFLGIGIDTSIASAEEVDNAIKQQTTKPVSKPVTKPASKPTNNTVEVSSIQEAAELVNSKFGMNTEEANNSAEIHYPINFGKHKGKEWKDVDLSYVEWVAKNSKVEWQREEASAELDRRNTNGEETEDKIPF